MMRIYACININFLEFSWIFIKKFSISIKKIHKNRVHFRISERYLNRGRSKTTKTIKLLCNSHFSHFWPKLVIFGSILDRVLKILETSYDKLDVLIQNFQSDYLNLQTSIFSFNCNILNEKKIFSKKSYLKISSRIVLMRMQLAYNVYKESWNYVKRIL